MLRKKELITIASVVFIALYFAYFISRALHHDDWERDATRWVAGQTLYFWLGAIAVMILSGLILSMAKWSGRMTKERFSRITKRLNIALLIPSGIVILLSLLNDYVVGDVEKADWKIYSIMITPVILAMHYLIRKWDDLVDRWT